MKDAYDVLVVGSGVGGLVAAARLAHSGRRTLLVERSSQIGGRASTREVDGFLVNTGAAFWEFGGDVEETCRLVGAAFDVRRPARSVVIRHRGRELCVDRVFGSRLQHAVLRGMARRAKPSGDASVSAWLGRYTGNDVVHRTVRNLCCSALAANSDELPAPVFLSYFTQESAFKEIGQCPQGTIGVPLALAGAVERAGGEVWLKSEVTDLHVADGRVTGARIQRDGEALEIVCRAAVSNAGPAATAAMARDALPADYLARVDAMEPCAILTVNIASRRPLTNKPCGAMLFTTTDRLCGMVGFTPTCPEMSPPGWNLYCAWGVPRPAVGDFDAEAELAATIEDLHREFAGMADARVLSTEVLRGGWPAQRAMSGADLPRATPIENLWNVGDGVKAYATGGTEACAHGAKLTAGEISAYLGAGET